MFFYLFPLGLTLENRSRGILAWVVAGVILYRFVLGFFFQDMRIQLLSGVPSSAIGLDTASLVLQSMFSPVLLPGINPPEHIFFLGIGVGSILLFWAGFGAALETTLGRVGFAALYLAGAAIGLAFAWFDHNFAMTGVFWLGHAATVAAAGACYVLFYTHDVRVLCFAWFVWGGGGGGVWLMPSMFLLVPVHLLMMVPQSMIWYTSEHSLGLAVHSDGLTPLAWNLLLTVAGAGMALLWVEARKAFGGSARESQTGSAMETTG